MVAGVVKEGETNHMTRLLYRVSRGKVATFFQNIGTVGDYGTEKSSCSRD